MSIVEGADGPEALPIVEAVPRDEDFYDFEARYEIGRTEFVCPADVPEPVTRRAQQLALDVYRLLGLYGFARVDLMLEQDSECLFVLEANAIPGPDRDLAAAPGRRGGGDRLRRAGRADPGARLGARPGRAGL